MKRFKIEFTGISHLPFFCGVMLSQSNTVLETSLIYNRRVASVIGAMEALTVFIYVLDTRVNWPNDCDVAVTRIDENFFVRLSFKEQFLDAFGAEPLFGFFELSIGDVWHSILVVVALKRVLILVISVTLDRLH